MCVCAGGGGEFVVCVDGGEMKPPFFEILVVSDDKRSHFIAAGDGAYDALKKVIIFIAEEKIPMSSITDISVRLFTTTVIAS